MGDEIKDRRTEQRCTKDVGMHCSYLHGRTHQVVTMRNFSNRGVYFESGWEISPGTLIVIRAMDAHDFMQIDAAADVPPYVARPSDPEACMGYRAHALVKVRRCVKLDDHVDQSHYGVGAQIQILTD
jgi:hypothetical protein